MCQANKLNASKNESRRAAAIRIIALEHDPAEDPVLDFYTTRHGHGD